MAGTFDHLFNHQHAGRPHPHPVALAATTCAEADGEAFPWGHVAGFAEIDAIYGITRGTSGAGEGRDRARAALGRLVDRVVSAIIERTPGDPDGAGDLHLLFGSVGALAELQTTLGRGRLVLDRRPFI